MSLDSAPIAAFVSFFLYASFFEWALHKYLMHEPRWRYPFRAHALIHHGIFRTGAAYFLAQEEHLKKIRFAWWNAPLILALHAPAILWIQHALQASFFFAAMTALGLYYFLYEYLHFCMHVPKARWFEASRWFLWLDSHHHMHHKRHFSNFNVVLPLADAVLGTLIRARDRMPAPDRRKRAIEVAVLSR